MFTLTPTIGYVKYFLLALVLVSLGAWAGRSLKSVDIVSAAQTELSRNADAILDCEQRVLPLKTKNEKVLSDNGYTFDYTQKKALKSDQLSFDLGTPQAD